MSKAYPAGPMSPSAIPASPREGNSPAPPRELTSKEKKQLRDRRAQKTLRERRERQLRYLQQQLNECHRSHDPDRIRQLIDLVGDLQEENRALRYQQEQLRKLIGSWGPFPIHDPAGGPSPVLHDGSIGMPDDATMGPIDPALAATSSTILDTLPASDHTLMPLGEASVLAAAIPSHPHESLIPVTRLLVSSPEVVVSNLGDSPQTDPKTSTPAHFSPSTPSLEMLPALVPAWMLVPLDEELNSATAMATCPWLSRPDLIARSPDLPSPLDLLHGTRRNFLANSIHKSLRQHNCRDPEVLAMGWLIYVYAKWRIAPNPKSFERIPPFMRPVLGQLQKTHQSCIDQIVWPRLRLNIIHHCSEDRLLAAMGLLSCCLKVRWKWGEDILERDENDELQIRGSFFETFLSPDGWGITSEFIDTNPELVEGMDVSRILYSPGM